MRKRQLGLTLVELMVVVAPAGDVSLTCGGAPVVDLGADGSDSVDYPDFGYAMAHALKKGKARRGVLVCGSGIGISIAANRYPDVRAALVHDALGARLARQHNDANVICFGGRSLESTICLPAP